MSDYSYTEIKDMQERALERVRAMQQRARETAEQARTELDGSDNGKEKGSPQPSVSELLSEEKKRKAHHIHLPTELPRREPEYPSFREFFTEENISPQKKAEQREKTGALDELLKEPDRAMLYPLLLLLRSEGADETLLMALLYIMT